MQNLPNKPILSEDSLKSWLTSLTSTESISKANSKLATAYPTPSALLQVWNPTHQHDLANVPTSSLALNETIPSLAEVKATFGSSTATRWLTIQLMSLNDFSSSNGMTDNQLTELSAIILANYYWLNLAEVMQFIAKFKLGIFGQFYGTVDPLKITSALQIFIRQRNESIDYHERHQKRIQDEQQWRQRRDGSVTYEEYLKLKSLAQQGDTNAQKQIYGIQHQKHKSY